MTSTARVHSLPASSCPSRDCHGPSRAKQLACLQASIRLIQSGRTVVGATGELIELGGSATSGRIEDPRVEEAKAPSLRG
eukprot:763562-Hanusia_phi.AAC.1